MRIHCDACGAEIRKEAAVVARAGDKDKEVYYFCTLACLESMAHLELVADPARGEDATTPP